MPVNERWKSIKGYDDFYRVSTCGNVRSFKAPGNQYYNNIRLSEPRELKKTLNNTGYYSVRLTNRNSEKSISDNFNIHRLVAETFIPKIEDKPFINHKDGDKLNNHVLNLEWVTNSENLQHAWENDLMDRGYKFTKDIAKEIKYEYREGGLTQIQLAKKHDTCRETISRILNNKYFKK